MIKVYNKVYVIKVYNDNNKGEGKNGKGVVREGKPLSSSAPYRCSRLPFPFPPLRLNKRY